MNTIAYNLKQQYQNTKLVIFRGTGKLYNMLHTRKIPITFTPKIPQNSLPDPSETGKIKYVKVLKTPGTNFHM